MRNNRGFAPRSRMGRWSEARIKSCGEGGAGPETPKLCWGGCGGSESNGRLVVGAAWKAHLPSLGGATPARYSSEPATGVLHLFLSCPPAPTAWVNVRRPLSNHWTQGHRKRRIDGPSPTALPQRANPKPSLHPSRRPFGGRGGRRFGRPGARGCTCEQISGDWELTRRP